MSICRSLHFVFSSVLGVALGFGSLAPAQEVVVDWAAKKIASSPGTVDKNLKAKVRIENVNDIMFTYSVSYQLTPLPATDFDAIAKAFALAGASASKAGEAASPCDDFSAVDTAFKALADAQTVFGALPTTGSSCSSAKPCDISLQQAQGAWKSSVQPKIVASEASLTAFTKACTSGTFAAAENTAAVALAKAKTDEVRVLSADHTLTKPDAIVLSPDSVTKLEVDQIYNGVTTQNGTYSVDLTPANNRLTLSAGALFSEVQNRTYTTRAVPNSTGSGTTNVLSVDGISKLSPVAVALLNYQIPHLDFEQAGLAISTGPVLRLGSSSDTSSFGYFAGVSIHLFHRFYVSPGMHLGQFADFPAGFSAVGQTVPTGIGTPTPVKRWTARFAFGLTYKAKDFSSLGLSGNVTPTTAKTGSAAPTKTIGAGSGGAGGATGGGTGSAGAGTTGTPNQPQSSQSPKP